MESQHAAVSSICDPPLFSHSWLAPPETRATLYYPPRMNPNMTEEQMLRFQETIIELYHLCDNYLVQYGYWVRTLFDGTWGYSPSMNEDVLPALLRRTPLTLELGPYSLLFLVPLGLGSGVIAGWKRSGAFDRFFRASAFLGTERFNPLMFSLIVFSWMPFAGLVHAIVLTLKQTDFVQAARAVAVTELGDRSREQPVPVLVGVVPAYPCRDVVWNRLEHVWRRY